MHFINSSTNSAGKKGFALTMLGKFNSISIVFNSFHRIYHYWELPSLFFFFSMLNVSLLHLEYDFLRQGLCLF